MGIVEAGEEAEQNGLPHQFHLSPPFTKTAKPFHWRRILVPLLPHWVVILQHAATQTNGSQLGRDTSANRAVADFGHL